VKTGLLLIVLAVAIALAAWRVGTPWGIPLAWMSREAASNQLRPGLRIGRRPRPREVESVDFLVDLTAEFPRVPYTRGYLALPILDAGVPDADALDHALDLVPTAGITMIHCAQGHGRTAMFAVCLLIQREGIPLAAALEAVRAARPAARMNQRQMRFVEGFARRCAR
jgi:protein-tyrosine phosphatase